MEAFPVVVSRLRMQRLGQWLDRILDQSLFDDVAAPRSEADRGPVLLIAETATMVVVKAEIPAIEAEEIELSVRGDMLHVQVKRKNHQDEMGKTWQRLEEHCVAFHRMLTLPAPVNPEAVEATVHNGILTVLMPKSGEAQARCVRIKAE